MTLFTVGTLTLLTLLAWATWRSGQMLREIQPTVNLLLLPAENLLRLALILACLALVLLSGQPFSLFGFNGTQPMRDVVIGLVVGVAGAALLPPLTHSAVARFGTHIYSPVVVRSIVPRTRREWLLVPLALVSAVLLEELLFRGLLLGGMSLLVQPIGLAVLWSIIFGLMHSPQGALGMVVAGALGLLLSALFLLTQGLLAPFVAHYLINLLQLMHAFRDRTWLETYEAHSGGRP